jgi:hypothetical protein
MDAIGADLSGETTRAQMARVGAAVQGEIDRAVTGDIGDTSMSGWRRSAPIAIVGSHKVVSDHAVLVQPVPAAKGPMAVLERGRNITGGLGAMAGPGVSADGSTRRTKSGGVRKTRSRRGRRWNGYTQGKGTMGDASQAIAKRAPALIDKELQRALRKHLRG